MYSLGIAPQNKQNKCSFASKASHNWVLHRGASHPSTIVTAYLHCPCETRWRSCSPRLLIHSALYAQKRGSLWHLPNLGTWRCSFKSSKELKGLRRWTAAWAGRLTGLRHLRRAHHRELHKDIGLPPGTEMSSVKGHSGGAVNPKWESRPMEAGEVCLATFL